MAQLANAQQRAKFEGHEVEAHRCSFSGTWDLEEEDANKIALDRVVVFLVAGRVTKAGFELNDSGELSRKTGVKVTEASMLRGRLRDEALTYIVEGPDAALLKFGAQAAAVELPGEEVDGLDLPEDHLDLDTGELLASGDTVETVGSVYAGRAPRDEQLEKYLSSPAPSA